MKSRRIALITLTGVALAAAGGGAVAATTSEDDPEQEVLAEAAKRLNVTPKALRDALAAARDAQVDQAVKDGRLTREEADRIKRRRAQSGRVLGFGHRHGGGPGMRGRFDHGGPHALIEAATKALGLTRVELLERLRDGKTLAEVAKAQGKELSAVKAAMRAALKSELDQAVTDKRLTRARADHILRRFDEHFDDFAQRSMDRRGGRGPGEGPGPGFGPGHRHP